MRRPRSRIWAFFVRDVSGEWLLCAHSDRAGARLEMLGYRRRGYETTEVTPFDQARMTVTRQE